MFGGATLSSSGPGPPPAYTARRRSRFFGEKSHLPAWSPGRKSPCQGMEPGGGWPCLWAPASQAGSEVLERSVGGRNGLVKMSLLRARVSASKYFPDGREWEGGPCLRLPLARGGLYSRCMQTRERRLSALCLLRGPCAPRPLPPCFQRTRRPLSSWQDWIYSGAPQLPVFQNRPATARSLGSLCRIALGPPTSDAPRRSVKKERIVGEPSPPQPPARHHLCMLQHSVPFPFSCPFPGFFYTHLNSCYISF